MGKQGRPSPPDNGENSKSKNNWFLRNQAYFYIISAILAVLGFTFKDFLIGDGVPNSTIEINNSNEFVVDSSNINSIIEVTNSDSISKTTQVSKPEVNQNIHVETKGNKSPAVVGDDVVINYRDYELKTDTIVDTINSKY